jgi:hypothetical protein
LKPRGFRVIVINLTAAEQRFFTHPRVQYRQADLPTVRPAKDTYGLVINCSTVEPVGLPAVTAFRKAAGWRLMAMQFLRRALKCGGIMLVKIPVGKDPVFGSLCPVSGNRGAGLFGQRRLMELPGNNYVLKCPVLKKI